MPIVNLPETLSKRLLQSLGVATIATGLLAGCQSPEEKAVADPNHLTVAIADGTLSGSYNPASFNEEIVRQALGGNCTGGQVATYSETAGSDGLTSFTATCTDGTSQADGTYTFQRAVTRPATAEEAAAAQEAVAGL